MNLKNMGEAPPPQYVVGDGIIRSLLLSRQPSIYSLTLEEFQNSMGGIRKDFESMNMDEFLKNIWTAEEAQGLALTCIGVSAEDGGPAAACNLQRQGSLTLPRTLSQKTVDEVWKESYMESGNGGGRGGNGSNLPRTARRQQTLGEMTLEEFLVRAGVVREDAQSMAVAEKLDGGNGMIYGEMLRPGDCGGLALGFGQQNRSCGGAVANQVMEFNGNSQVPNQSANLGICGNGERSNQQQRQLFPKQFAVAYTSPIHLANKGFVQGGGMGGGVGIVGGGTAGGVTVAAAPSMSQLSSDGPGNGNNSSLSPVSYMFNRSVSRKRGGGPVDKVVERRQKRMIKNRESAARSRARKQAYTMELEAEVAKLKDENQELRRKQEEVMEMQKHQAFIGHCDSRKGS
ncbi:hypothetical protein Syun_004222 [Stephania yunnanensis]|uniref:BZIP domain-containing protein n=1 Tax=Stephania yunnanensis TaxID=152371 RepID=A0AAP0L561_9MAGN